MNDIKLTPTTPGHYDWNFKYKDIETINGNTRLINAAIHTILLKYQELKLTNYQNKGNNTYNHIKEHNNQELIENILITELKTINGITDAKIETTTNKDTTLITKITLIKDDMTEVEINGI